MLRKVKPLICFSSGAPSTPPTSSSEKLSEEASHLKLNQERWPIPLLNKEFTLFHSPNKVTTQKQGSPGVHTAHCPHPAAQSALSVLVFRV